MLRPIWYTVLWFSSYSYAVLQDCIWLCDWNESSKFKMKVIEHSKLFRGVVQNEKDYDKEFYWTAL